MPHGWIILDKPHGLGSTQAVAAVKRVCRQAGLGKVKVGHGGTLDPLATGVLPIALGEATKLTGRMLDASKVYAFTIAFGTETDTLDLEGQVIAESPVRPSRTEVEAILPRFTGPIQQVPPAYSAIKVDGERAYDLARAGEAVELKSREVTVYQINFLPEPGRGTGEAGGGGLAADSASGDSPSTTLRAVPLPVPGRIWRKSPLLPTFPRAPISAAWRATLPRPWAQSAMSPCCGGSRPGRSGSNRRFHWTN